MKLLNKTIILIAFTFLSCGGSNVILQTSNNKFYNVKGKFKHPITIDINYMKIDFKLKNIDSLYINSNDVKIINNNILYPITIKCKDSLYSGLINFNNNFIGKNKEFKISIPLKSIKSIKTLK